MLKQLREQARKRPLGAVSAGAGVGAALVMALGLIYTIATRPPAPDLVFQGVAADFHWPPFMELDSLHAAEVPWARVLVRDGVDTVLLRPGTLVDFVRDSILHGVPLLASSLSGAILNRGDQLATDVRLRVPGAVFAEVTNEARTVSHHVKGAPIPIGVVGSREQVTVVVWSEWRLLAEDEIVLEHPGGVGEATVLRADRRPSWLLTFARTTALALLVSVVVVQLMLRSAGLPRLMATAEGLVDEAERHLERARAQTEEAERSNREASAVLNRAEALQERMDAPPAEDDKTRADEA